jgi:DNA-binding winged helix-turn-helix (wHTH) protein/Tol biopolymer transport system component
MAADPKHFYEFGPFKIDVSERTLSRDGQIVAITPKVFNLLLMLVRNSGVTVDKQTLMREIWPDSFVEEGNLPVNMTALRRALGESPDEHTYIQTVPRRGYRFVAEVSENWVHNGGPATRTRHRRIKALAGLSLAGVETTSPPTPALAATKRVLLAWALAAAGIGAAVVLAVYYGARPATRTSVVRSTIPIPENAQLDSWPVYNTLSNVAVSPDGLELAFTAESHGTRSLWLRPLGAPSAHALAGTSGAVCPFWSPDSRFIGFFSNGQLKKIEVSGGAAQTLCEAPMGRGGTWSRDGVIVFAPSDKTGLYRISESGGQPVALPLDNERSEQTFYRFPCFLPDGRHFIYRAGGTNFSPGNEMTGIYAGSLESNESKLILRGDTYAAYASSHLLFWREGSLMAQPFDGKSLRLTGDAVPVAEGVQFNPRTVEAEFSVTQNGILVFVSGAPALGRLAWFDRDGKEVGELGEPGLISSPRISPDGKRVAAQVLERGGDWDIWVYEPAQNERLRLKVDQASAGCPVWSPDGSRIAFSSTRKGIDKPNIYQKDSKGAGNEEVLFESDDAELIRSWSSDGRFIAYNKLTSSHPGDRMDFGGNAEIWVLPLTGERKPFPFLQSRQFYQGEPQFSPDGHFIVYESGESSSNQIYVRPFPGPGAKQQVSAGWEPRWRRDGKELFFLAPGNKMMAVGVRSNGSSLKIGNARFLFEAHPWLWHGTAYDVTPDGTRFIIVTATEGPTPTINLVVNWTADLKG